MDQDRHFQSPKQLYLHALWWTNILLFAWDHSLRRLYLVKLITQYAYFIMIHSIQVEVDRLNNLDLLYFSSSVPLLEEPSHTSLTGAVL